MTKLVAISMVALVIIWGSAFPTIKIALGDLSAPHLTLGRHLVASVVLYFFLLLSGCRLLPRKCDVPYFLLLGFIGITIYHMALNYGELRVSAGGASLIMASAPALTAILAYFVYSEKFGRYRWIGSAICFSGVILLVLGEERSIGVNIYAGLVFLSAVSTALFFVLQKRLLSRYRPVEVTAFVTWAGTIPLMIFLPSFASNFMSYGMGPIAATIYAGIFPSAIAYSLLAFALSRTSASLIATFLYAVPVFSLGFSWFLLYEIPGPLTLAGGIVVLAGIAIVNQTWVVKPKSAVRN
ncbi:MAG: DMT family transporter [Deinococcales bacterium]|nr:DMT family transporter [Deinococcales bacterium]